jgi:hypothetical protein
MHKLVQFIAPIIPMVSGCAGSVVFGHTIGQAHPTSTVQAASAPDAKLRAVALAFTSKAGEKIDADPRFNRDALLAAIQGELRTHDLIDDNGNTHADGIVEITIDDYAIRPTSNAVVLGYVLSNAALTGDVEVRDAAGQELQTFKIKANSRLATPANDGQAQPLASLYREFADLMVSELMGVHIKADNSNTEMPR